MSAKSNKRLLLSMTVLAASMAAGLAGAAELDRVAQLGLVPPATGAATEAAESGMKHRLPGLKLPRDVTDRGGFALDFLSGEEGGRVIYGGTRTALGLGSRQPRTIGGLRYPFAGSWSSIIEASSDAPTALSGRGYGLVGQVHRALPGGWGVSLGLHYNVYETGTSRLLGDASEPWSLHSFGLPLHPATGGVATTTGYELRLNYRYGERNMLGLTYGSGNEFDYSRYMPGLYPGDSRQFGLIGEHWLTPEWALNYGLMAQDQIGPHRGQGLRLGLRYRF